MSVSNLTVRLLARCFSSPDAAGVHTVDDSSNDLMDLAILDRVAACKSLRDGGSEGRLDGLEGALETWPSEGGGAQRPRDAAVTGVSISMAVFEACQEVNLTFSASFRCREVFWGVERQLLLMDRRM